VLDAINLGLIASESRPGGNVTGLSFRTEGLTSKQVELLASYGVNLSENFHRAAAYVNKILKGARPGDLPVNSPPVSRHRR